MVEMKISPYLDEDLIKAGEIFAGSSKIWMLGVAERRQPKEREIRRVGWSLIHK